jgi:hypothetical protein
MNIRQIIKQHVRLLAIQLVMRRPAPSRIPLSGMDRLRERDYFLVEFGDEVAPRSFLVKSLDEQRINGLWYPAGSDRPLKASFPKERVCDYDILITHYLAELEIKYTSAIIFLIHHHLRIGHFKLARERIARLMYSQRGLAREKCIEILRMLVEMVFKQGRTRISSWIILETLYGTRLVHHSDFLPLQRYYEFILGSLLASGELTKDNVFYQVAPKALATLAAFEEDDRRHRDQVRQQKVIGFLTLALVGVGLLQSYLHWVG